MPSLSLPRLTGIYLRIGNFTFGGGDPSMAALQTELVEQRGWLSLEKYGLVYALARITPGTNMLAFCAGSAWELLGWRGAIAAVLASTAPAALLAVLLTAGYGALRNHPHAMAAIAGMLAAAVGIMATSAWQLLARHLTSRNQKVLVRAVCIAGASLLLSFRYHVAPVTVLALAAVAGFFWQVPEKA
jgi:chromate transporter